MIRKNSALEQGIDILTDAAIIFLSYVLAVYIRYEILDSHPGLNTLSAPYLLLAGIYSIVMAYIFWLFEVSRTSYLYPGDNSFLKVFSINAIGCLVLLSFFYIVNVIYFSRWALLLFWGISSLLILIKKGLAYRLWIRIKKAKGSRINILLVGDGKLAQEYVISMECYGPAMAPEIIGYLGPERELGREDGYIEKIYPAKGEEYGAAIPRLGTYADLEETLQKYDVEEVVFAMDEPDTKRMRDMLEAVRRRKLMACMVPCCGEYIRQGTVIQKIGETRLINMGGTAREGTEKTYVLGAVLSFAMLVLMLLVRRFGIGELKNLSGYESYKGILFAAAGIFLFLSVSPRFPVGKVPYLKGTLLAGILCSAAIVLYECVYANGKDPMRWIPSDLFMTWITLALCWIGMELVHLLGKEDMPFLS